MLKFYEGPGPLLTPTGAICKTEHIWLLYKYNFTYLLKFYDPGYLQNRAYLFA